MHAPGSNWHDAATKPMNEAYRRLKNNQPERAAPVAGAFASDPRALRAWVDALPMANFAIAAQRLRDGLRALNQQHLDGVRRLEALEIMRPAVTQLAAGTDKQIIGASFPLPPHKIELGALALAFQHELALGYRRALVELCAPGGNVPFLRGKQVVLAAVRALQHGDELLAKAYLLYRTAPAGAWQGLHDAYGFIASLRLDDRAIDEAQAQSLNAREAYVRALLFALANPYRCTQREQAEVIALTRNLAPHCELRQGMGAANDILIHADADRGPGYLPEERVTGQRDVLALHLDTMFAFIDTQLMGTPAHSRTTAFRQRGGTSLQVDVGLARRLLGTWNAHGERAHARLGGGYMLDTVLGLQDLHFVLAGGTDFESFMRRVSGQMISLSEGDRGAAWRLGAGDSARATRLPARVLDQSLGGYRIVWERGAAGGQVHARVGELVGLALPETNADARPDWMAGVIRWIRIDDQGRVDAGVELLARRVLPVGARALGGAQQRAAVRGLLLAPLATNGNDDYHSLVVSTEIERAASDIELTVPADLLGPPRPARTEAVTGLRVIEATGIYQHFALPERADAMAAIAPSARAIEIPLGV
ncbi:MAG: hypothetical protein ABIW82_15610 [Dokdonella sp.]